MSKSTKELYAYAENTIKNLGFDYFIFRMITPSAQGKVGGSVLTNVPPEIMKPYEGENRVEDNPIIRHCRTSLLPIIWSSESCPRLIELTQKKTGNYAWTQALHDRTGVASLITVIQANNEISDQDVVDKGRDVMWLCSKLHTSFMESYLSDPSTTNSPPKVTERELEILNLHGKGKTASEISIILYISSRTVNFHLNNIYRKLGAKGNKQALVYAAKLGII